MKDFSEFKNLLNNGWLQEILDKSSMYANKQVEEECSNEDGFTKAYAYSRLINEGMLVFMLEKYHEWLSENDG